VFLLANPRAAEIEIYNSQGQKIDLKQNSMQLITDVNQLQKQVPAMTVELMTAVTKQEMSAQQQTTGTSRKK
jgi:phage gp45-like